MANSPQGIGSQELGWPKARHGRDLRPGSDAWTRLTPQFGYTPANQAAAAVANFYFFAAAAACGVFVATAPQEAQAAAPQVWHSAAAPAADHGSVPSAEYQFGTHSTALANAEALKSQVWAPARGVPKAACTYFIAAPAGAELPQPQVWHALAGGAKPRVPSWTAVGGQDPTQLAPQLWAAAAQAPAVPGCVPGAEYQFGTHSAALATAEAAKTRIWGSVAKPPVPPASGAFFTAAPQWVPDLAPRFTAPLLGATPRCGALALVGQQAYADPQPWVTSPLVAGHTARAAAFFAAPEQAYTNPPSTLRAPLTAGHTPAVLAAITAGEQAYTNPPPRFTPSAVAPLAPSVPGSVPGAEYQFGTHARALADAEARKSQVWAAATGSSGWINGWVQAGPDPSEYPTLPASFTAASVRGLLSGHLGAFALAPEQAYTNVAPSVGHSATAPLVSGSVPSAEYQFGTHAAALADAERQKSRLWPSVIGPSGRLGARWAVPEQAYVNPPPWVVAASPKPLSPGRLGTYFTAAPQLLDLTLQPAFTAAAPKPPVPGSVPGAEYRFGTQAAALYEAERQKTRLWPSATTTAAPVSGRLGTFFTAAPAQQDTRGGEAFFSAPLTYGGWITGWVQAAPDPSEYPPSQAWFSPALVHQIVAGRVAPFFAAAEQPYVNPAAVLVAPAPKLPLLPHTSAFFATLEQAYTNAAPWVVAPPVAGHTPRTGTWFWAAPVDPSQLVPRFWAPQHHAPYAVPAMVLVGPQLVVPPPPQLWVPQPRQLVHGVRLPPMVLAAPQYLDTTLQPFIQRHRLAPTAVYGSSRVTLYSWQTTVTLSATDTT